MDYRSLCRDQSGGQVPTWRRTQEDQQGRIGGDLHLSGAIIGQATDSLALDYQNANVKNAVLVLADAYMLGDNEGKVGPYGVNTGFVLTGSAVGGGSDPGDSAAGLKTAEFYGDIVTSGSFCFVQVISIQEMSTPDRLALVRSLPERSTPVRFA